MTASKQNQAAVREINRILLQSVRNDWSFPNNIISGLDRTIEPLSYRERYYSTSDGSSSDSLDDDDDDDEDEEESTDEDDEELEGHELKFESPDSVAEFIDRKIQARKRKKRKLLEDEIEWNGGLCFFMRRRNAWTGALSPEAVKARESNQDTIMDTDADAPAIEGDRATSESIQESHNTEQSEAATAEAKVDVVEESKSSSPKPPHEDTDSGIAIPTSSSQPFSPFDAPSDSATLTDILLPIAPPLLPATNPVRSSIMARSDSELYEKVVRDSRTPAVPINLAHMMRVIVQGWKDEGNWPPKSSVVASNIMLADTATTSAGRAEGPRASLLSGHKHFKQGVESVRRVLRLSGSAPPPGD
jgi:Protein of unknown function (DUF4050)